MRALRAQWSRRVHVRLTPLGWAYLGGVLGLTVAAFNTGNNLLYVVLSLLLSVLVLQSVLAEMNLRGVRLARQLPEEVFAFEAASGAFVIHNPRQRLPAFALELAEVERGEARGAAMSVPAEGRLSLPVSWTFAQRGEVEMGKLRLSSSFPFGLSVRYKDLDLGGSLVVYPRRGQRAAARMHSAHGSARQDDSRPGGDGDFLGLRPYQPGDPVRDIHWPNSARGLGPLVVQRGSSQSEQVVVRVSGTRGRLEQELERASGEVVRHLARGHAVGLSLPDRELATGRGQGHRRKLLSALALLPPEQW